MLSRREIVLIIILLVLLAGTAYFLLFFQPTNAEIQTLRADIEEKEQGLIDAEMLESTYAALTKSRDALLPQWEQFEKGVPRDFDDTEVLRIIQRVIYPYTEIIDVSFPDQAPKEASNAEESEPTLIYTVVVNFNVPYEDIDPILEGFAEESLVNRVVQYNLTRREDYTLGTVYYGVTLELDFLTQNI
jgi:hypothetical protein